MRITRPSFELLAAHLESGYPRECCGVLLGNDNVVTEVARTENERSDSAHNRYLIAPRAYDQIERTANDRGLQVMGIYHSHPDGGAEPSEFDRGAAWPELAYLIVPVATGRAGPPRCWRLLADADRFDEEPVEIVARPTRMAR